MDTTDTLRLLVGLTGVAVATTLVVSRCGSDPDPAPGAEPTPALLERAAAAGVDLSGGLPTEQRDHDRALGGQGTWWSDSRSVVAPTGE